MLFWVGSNLRNGGVRPERNGGVSMAEIRNDDFRKQIPVHLQRTLNALQQCRTSSLGGHVDACDACGLLQISYNSYRNRNCPKCQGLQKEMWTIQREEELLPVPYFHGIFTLPHELNGLCLGNPRFMMQLGMS